LRSMTYSTCAPLCWSNRRQGKPIARPHWRNRGPSTPQADSLANRSATL